MPSRPPHPCSRCGRLTHARLCESCLSRHRAETDTQRGTATQRGYGTDWQALRRLILQRDPWCKHCHAARSTMVDHIIPRRQGGSDDPNNLQGLCFPCHNAWKQSEDWKRKAGGGSELLGDRS